MTDLVVNDVTENGEVKRYDVEASGKKYAIIRTDPYGFWAIKSAQGRLPDELSGNYTTTGAALSGIKKYLNKKES